jgi:predicted choloylglycine hydrolase
VAYRLSYIEFNILFKIVYNFYKKFASICNLAYLAKSYKIPNQLTKYCNAIIHFKHSLDKDVLNIKRAKRLNKSPGPRYT